jgi:MFS family permease
VTPADRTGARRLLLGALSASVSASYGALLYGFSVLLTGRAAGGEFSATVLSAAYGGAVLSGGLAAVPVGRFADRHGVAGLVGAGSLLGCAGLAGFAAAREPWQVLAVWWVVLGPVTAMTFYEPAYVAIGQWFDERERARAVATLTFLAGLSGPVYVPATGALVDALGWRPATVVLGVVLAAVGGAAAWLFATRAPRPRPGLAAGGDPGRRRASLGPVIRSARFLAFTAAAGLGYGAIESVVVHRVARFVELGFTVALVTGWAAISGLASIPGRYLLPVLAGRVRPTAVLAGVLLVMAAAVGLAVGSAGAAGLAGHFLLWGLVFGAALPLRALVMGDWYGGGRFGAIMGAQALVVAVARAGGPAAIGALHDRTGGYPIPMAVLAVALVAAAVLVVVSARLPR